ncbi:hypothetical protein [Glycomyces algeriensis]|uniref:Uncharacterized protein n=1 Tax=Glycomyces algeriensis TaxID=256037 RepID=A0A9W6G887_9ACTN|nr:hypothetical protein [Glycomyces algeriensis]MDA1364331.1 hypothetical protein [Glycomyces algeriensis]MDR7350364.1 phosphatidylglycerophosphate synthase [Glycomyces algeriensis]GLI43069.1 hypothetical protein GALLR39Z86_29190 [Glycomyces algeriensis]
MSDDGSRSSGWHWHEYGVGPAGEVAHACARSLNAFLVGLGCSFALILGAGILAEENLLGDPGLESAIDHLMRLSVGLLMVFVLVAAFVAVVASYLREVTTSKALVRAAERGASSRAVPAPDQVASVINEPAAPLKYFGWANAALAGVLGVVGLLVVLMESSAEGWMITLVALGYAAVMSLLGYACQEWLPRTHERRRVRIAAHWTAEDEARAWKRARSAGRRGGGKQAPPGSARGASFVYLAGVFCAVGFIALLASMVMRCGTLPARGQSECDEVYYSSFIERVLSWGFWIFAVAVPLAVLFAVVGVLLEWQQRRAERADLLDLLAGPRAASPDKDLLAYHVERHAHPLARVGSALSGAGLVFSISAYMLGEGFGLGSQEEFAAYRTEALIAMLVSAGLFLAATVGTGIANARGRELRNALMERWPRQPFPSVNGEGKIKRPNQGLERQRPRSRRPAARNRTSK